MPSRSGSAPAAFRAEASALCASLESVTEPEFDRPTRCTPWTVAALLAHVGMGADQVLTVLAQPAPSAADTDAAGYYRPGTRFASATDRERVDGAVAAAARAGSGAALAARFARTWRDVCAAVAEQPAGRLVYTRHGDAMPLDDFMVTRAVELVVHGLDLADALEREPWTRDSALEVVTGLLVDDAGAVLDALGSDPVALVRTATGRAGTGPAIGPAIDPQRLRAAGVRWLALG